MLPTRDPPQNTRHTQTECDGLEKNIPEKWKGKKSRGSNTHIRKIDFKKRAIKIDPEGHFIILTGRIHQDNINITNMCVPNTEHPNM